MNAVISSYRCVRDYSPGWSDGAMLAVMFAGTVLDIYLVCRWIA